MTTMAPHLAVLERRHLRLTALGVGAVAVSPESLVDRLVAMQGQDLGGALWSIGMRTGSTEQELRQAFDDGLLVRSWALRGTLHVTTPGRLRALLAVCAERMLQQARPRHVRLGLDTPVFDRAEAIARESLADGALARRALLDRFAADGVPTDGQRSSHLLAELARRGVLCWGPFAGRTQLLVLLDAWAPAAHEVDRAAALAALTVGYLHSHGPATEKDLTRWAGLTVIETRAAIAAVRETLAEARLGAETAYLDARLATLGPARAAARVALLPGFDEYVLGYADRSFAIPADYAARVVPGENGIFLPTVVFRGRAVGTWCRDDRATVAGVVVSPFEPLSPAVHSGLASAAKLYGRFRGMESRVTVLAPGTPVSSVAGADVSGEDDRGGDPTSP